MFEENDLIIRFSFFAAALLLFGLMEYFWPRRPLHVNKKMRWRRNLALVVIDILVEKLLLPFTLVGVALYAETQRIGLTYWLDAPPAVMIFPAVMILDFVVCTQHMMFHKVPLLWRLHRVHHIDQEIDVTTGLRFHPLEIVISTLIKAAAILLIGAPITAVIIFEIVLNVAAMFNHSNICLPGKLDRLMRLLLVTPDMHRVHHSVIPKETNSNYGFCLSWWDRTFKTYRDQPSKGHLDMEIGLTSFRNAEESDLITLLRLPFISKRQGKE